MSTETMAPEDELSILEERKGDLQARLAELVPIRGDERAELARAVAFAADISEVVERRERVAELNAEAEGIEGAIQLLEVRIAEVSAVVADRERDRKIARAAELRRESVQASSEIRPVVEAFAREQWGPLIQEARKKWNVALQAEIEARRAQGMLPDDVRSAMFDYGPPSSGNPDLDAGLDRLAFPPPY